MLKYYNVLVYLLKLHRAKVLCAQFNHSTSNAKTMCVYFDYSKYILLRVYFILLIQTLEQELPV